jgi:hypothetical protein
MRVYLVNQREVLRILGSNDSALLKEMLAKEGQGESLAWYDEELAEEIEEECPGFSHADALRDIFAGHFTRPEAGFVYGWTFDFICSYLGRWMHDRFHRCSTSFLETLDAKFAEHQVPLRLLGGLIDNSPISLPSDRDGLPGIGYWSPQQIRDAAPVFRTLLGKETDPTLIGALQEIEAWLSAAQDEPDSMIVGVFG